MKCVDKLNECIHSERAICYEAIEVPFSISAISYYFAAACGNNSSLDNNKSSNSDGGSVQVKMATHLKN